MQFKCGLRAFGSARYYPGLEEAIARYPDSARIDEEIFGELRKDLDLYLMQPAAIQDLHRTLLNDPPSGTEDQDLPALAAAYQVAVGAARRLLVSRQNQEQAEAEKKAGLG